MEALALLLFGGLILTLAFADHDPPDEEGNDRDTITGDEAPNNLTGGAGEDDIFGLGGADTLDGGEGRDLLEGGAGLDQLFGGAGDDTLRGGAEGAAMEGGAGNDLLDATGGSGRLDGGEGDDTLISDGSALLIGNGGNDTIILDPAGQDAYPTLADFTPGQDRLEIHYSPTPGIDAEVLLNPDPSVEGANSFLEMNGVIIGYVIGEFGIAPGDISLVPKPA